MEPAFWKERWEKGETGFHEGRTNSYLLRHWDSLGLPPNASVLVPLCGKSVDLLWLRERGFHVVGVELSAIAVRAFRAESGLDLEATAHGSLTRHHTNGLDLWQGDIFDLTRKQLPRIDAIFDRAALIALPRPLRDHYVEQLRMLCPRALAMLLVATFSPQADETRPPFSIDRAQLQAYFGDRFRIETLESRDILDEYPALQRRGFRELEESAYLFDARPQC